MLMVKFCYVERSGRYVGWTQYNNGTYYASGDSLDKMMKNLQVSLKYHHNVDEVAVLDSKPSSEFEIPVYLMDKKFVTPNIKGIHPKKEREKKRKISEAKKGLKLLDRETLEKSLREMADDYVINGVKEEPKEEVVVENKPIVVQKEDREYDYKIVEDEDGKRLVIFELVKVAEWKLAK